MTLRALYSELQPQNSRNIITLETSFVSGI
jgi:hypothetical protein